MFLSTRSARTGAAFAIMLLTGCAAAHVHDLRQTGTLQPQRTLTVVMTCSAPARGAGSEMVVRAMTDIQAMLLSALNRAGVPTVAAAPGVPLHGPELDVDVVAVDPGSPLARTVIGFGAGESRLAVSAVLVDRRQTGAPDLAFDVVGDSGRKPGLILPAGVAIGTANALHFVIGGGVDLALDLRDASAQDMRHASAAISTNVIRYYRLVGWLPPA